MDYYELLGVPRGASQEEIKKAFHRLAHKHHPNKGGDEKRFKEINEAYQVLSNAEKRGQYDRFGRVFEGGQQPGQGFGGNGDANWFWGNPNSGFQSSENGEGFDFDIGGLGDIFEGFFNGGGGRSKRKNLKKGRDIRIDIEIPLEAVISGITKKIVLTKTTECQRCAGSGAEPGTKIKECFSCRGAGEVQQIKRTFLGSFTTWAVCPECKGEGNMPEKPCNVCGGEGRIKGEEEIEISIPKGVDGSQVIKIFGKGGAGKHGGKAGDLYARILIQEHSVFKRRGDDLFASLPLSITQAGLGGEIGIDTLEKTKITLRIPEGTETGKIFKISGKGIPHFSSFGRGDLYIETIVKTPKKLTREQRELLEKLKQTGV
jgi:molecular chaperone DnaJ